MMKVKEEIHCTNCSRAKHTLYYEITLHVSS